jgi:hypothetical protein
MAVKAGGTAHRVWRASGGLRVVAAGFAVAGGLIAIGEWSRYLRGDSPASDIVGMSGLAIMAAGIGVVMNRLAFHPRLVIDGSDVVIINPMRTHRVPLNRIRLAEPTHHGLRLLLDDETAFAAWAVQTTNLTLWSGESGRAAQVIEALREAGAPLPRSHKHRP